MRAGGPWFISPGEIERTAGRQHAQDSEQALEIYDSDRIMKN